MSSSAIPYHLRPHKAVDRRLFLDLLARCERYKSLARHTYISMGAFPLEDHKQVHRILGTKKLISFDYDGDIVARQIFNKPIDGCHCLKIKSGDLIANLDAEMKGCKINNNGVLFWLDYTDPKEIRSQLLEFHTLLDTLAVGDVVRVTVNAEVDSLSRDQKDGKPEYQEKLRAKRFKKLSERLDDYLPYSVKADDMTVEGLPTAYSKAFAEAARLAFPASSRNTFMPLSLVRYADGQQMLSMTGMIIERRNIEKFLKATHIRSWPFWSSDWTKVHKLIVPSLTVRERLYLEKCVTSKSSPSIIKDIGFHKAGGISMRDFLASYKKYYRFYPSLLTAEL